MTPKLGDIWAFNSIYRKMHYLIVMVDALHATLSPLDSIDQQTNEPITNMVNSQRWSFIA